jgi:hypothetical protein
LESLFIIEKNTTMAKYTKKWEKEFTIMYSVCLSQLESMEKEYKEMVKNNPDKYISIYPETSNIELGQENGFYVYDNGNDEEPHVDIQLSSANGSFNFTFTELEKLIDLRNQLIKAIDNFKRVPKTVTVTSGDDCDDDLDENAEEVSWTIKAEQPLTQSWTYTVMAKSACEAIKKIENDEDGVEHNDDTEYYDYGDIEYEAI